METWGKIALGTRLDKQVESQFVVSWSQLIASGLRPGDGFLISADKPAHRSANDLVRRFLATDCDSLLFLDSDADVNATLVEEMRELPEGQNYDGLMAFVVRRGWPPAAVWFQDAPPGTEDVASGALISCLVTSDNVTEEVAAMGLHATLIRRRVFEKMLADGNRENFGWFYYPRHSDSSEDIGFCRDARALGFHFAATTCVKTGHISKLTTGWETYQEYIKVNGLEVKAKRWLEQRFGANGEIAVFQNVQ